MGRLQSSRGPQLGLDRGPLEAQGGDQGRRRALARPSRARPRADVMRALDGSDRGRRFVEERIVAHQKTFGYKSIWSHEFAFKTWREDPAPIVEAIRGYIATDYDYPSNIQAVRDDLEAAKARSWRASTATSARQLQEALDLVAGHEPAHPGPPLLHRPGDQRAAADRADRDRPQARRGGRARRRRGRDVPPLQRAAAADGRPVGVRRARAGLRPPRLPRGRRRAAPAVVGRHGHRRPRSTSRTTRSGASPRSSTRGEPSTTGEVKGLAASPGVVEGPARFVASLDEFDQVKEGEILVCRMTNPAWVVLFTKITGLVTEAGGAVVHPAVVAREFGIPAVVGTTNAGRADQDRRPHPRQRQHRSRRDPRVSEPEWMAPDSLEEALALRAERGDEATVLAGGTFLGILMNQGFLTPSALLSLGRVDELKQIEVVRRRAAAGRDGLAPSRRARGRSAAGRCWRARSGWWRARACATRRPSAACSPMPTTRRTRRRCSPRSTLARSCARPRGDRAVAIGELILGYYETCIEPDELLVEVRVPAQPERAVVPQVPLALGRGPAVRGRRGGERRPSAGGRRRGGRDAAGVPGPVRRRAGRRSAARYAERIEPLSDSRGSAKYRRRVIAAEVGARWRTYGPARDRRAALLGRGRAARHAARRVRALAAPARARGGRRRRGGAGRRGRADARRRGRPRAVRLPGQGPARARRPRAPRRRRRRRRRRAHARGGPRRRAARRGRVRGAARRHRPDRGGRARRAARARAVGGRRPSDAVSIDVRPIAARTSATASASATATSPPASSRPT